VEAGTSQTQSIEREVRVEASPETVFEFFTDPEKMSRWKGHGATLDPRPGGVYRIDIGSHVALGEYVEVDPPRRVVFTWGWEGGQPIPAGSSTIEVTLTPDGDATIVRLVHRDLPAEAVEPHSHGWDQYMPRLAIAAAGGDAGPDPNRGDGS
jgi:uncharacterized protein YndB with AHSA1/START domain